jgi:hypothetical protein
MPMRRNRRVAGADGVHDNIRAPPCRQTRDAMTQLSVTDFFVSYATPDQAWAEWIAWALEEAGYTTCMQAWDFKPGVSFPVAMHHAMTRCERTVAVLSPSYLGARFTAEEWGAAMAADPGGEAGKLLPIRVVEFNPSGLFAARVYLDLVGLGEARARAVLLRGAVRGRAKPLTAPAFPGGSKASADGTARVPPVFPGEPTARATPSLRDSRRARSATGLVAAVLGVVLALVLVRGGRDEHPAHADSTLPARAKLANLPAPPADAAPPPPAPEQRTNEPAPAGAFDAETMPGRRPLRIAVLPFRGEATGAPEPAFIRSAAGIITAELLKLGKDVRIIERAEIEQLLQEIDLTRSAYFNQQTVPRFGRLLGADLLVVGSGALEAGRGVLEARLSNAETAEVVESSRVEFSEGGATAATDQLASTLRGRIRTALERRPRRTLP